MNYRIEEKEEMRIVGVKKWFSTVNNQQMQGIPKMWDEFPDEMSKQLKEISSLKGFIGLCADMYNGGFDYWIGSVSEEKKISASTC